MMIELHNTNDTLAQQGGGISKEAFYGYLSRVYPINWWWRF